MDDLVVELGVDGDVVGKGYTRKKNISQLSMELIKFV